MMLIKRLLSKLAKNIVDFNTVIPYNVNTVIEKE
jgi:hypothetical protein